MLSSVLFKLAFTVPSTVLTLDLCEVAMSYSLIRSLTSFFCLRSVKCICCDTNPSSPNMDSSNDCMRGPWKVWLSDSKFLTFMRCCLWNWMVLILFC